MLRTPVTLLGALAVSVSLAALARAETLAKPFVVAQSEQEKAKHKEEERKKGPPPGGERKAPTALPKPPGPPPGGGQPPMPKASQQPFERKGPDFKKEAPKQVMPAQPTPPAGGFAPHPKGPDFKKEAPKQVMPAQPTPPAGGFVPHPKGPEFKKEAPKQVMPVQPTPPPAGGFAPIPKGPVQGVVPKGPAAGPAGAPGFQPPGPRGPAVAVPRFEDVQKGRKEHVEAGGRRVIEEPGNRIIVKQGDRIVIRHDEAERFRFGGRDVRTERRPDGFSETFYVRPDGMRVISVTDGSGRLVRRYRRGPDGREYNIIDNRRFMRDVAIGVGVGAAVGLAILALAPPRITIPREKYIVDYSRASDDDLYEAFEAPPVDVLERAYSLEEIRDNFELRQRMRYVELSDITFEFGAWEITPDQYPKLERLARVMLRVLRRNPDEVFLIEGHTDAVGSDVDNLSLSDRRASSVAEVLSETFGVPPENLVTQGYGKQFLKINTPGPEPLNRRVQVRRIGPLMAER